MRASRPSRPAAGGGNSVYGYLGKRGILGTLTAAGPRWSGSFHFSDDSELVLRVTESDRHDAIGKNSSPECVEAPSTMKFITYRLNPSTLAWAPAPPPPGLTEQRLARGTPIVF